MELRYIRSSVGTHLHYGHLVITIVWREETRILLNDGHGFWNNMRWNDLVQNFEGKLWIEEMKVKCQYIPFLENPKVHSDNHNVHIFFIIAIINNSTIFTFTYQLIEVSISINSIMKLSNNKFWFSLKNGTESKHKEPSPTTFSK